MCGPSLNDLTLFASQLQPDWDHLPRTTPKPAQNALNFHQTDSPARQPVKKSASDTTTISARLEKNVSMYTRVGTQAARETTLAKGAPKILELQRAHTPLQHIHLERELRNHPDKA